jgi:uncharacterized membrane protein
MSLARFSERLCAWFGAGPSILLHAATFTLWTVLHFSMGIDPSWDIITFVVSIEAILLALLLLAGQNAQSHRIEEVSKADLAATRELATQVKAMRKKVT